MIHTHTEPTKENFEQLESRLLQINDPHKNNANNITEILRTVKGPTLIMATGGSKVVSYFLKCALESKESFGTICELIEPRDYFYKDNIKMYKNLIAVSVSGKSEGIATALKSFPEKKYLITQEEKFLDDVMVVAWGNESYKTEKSFISLVSSLGPMLHILDAIESQTSTVSPSDCERVNEKLKLLLKKSEEIVKRMNYNFSSTNQIQVLTGYDTKTSSCVLESNIVEAGLAVACVHDKGSFCHGRNNILFTNSENPVIYLSHKYKALDETILSALQQYPNVYSFTSFDIDENYYWKEFFLALQMYYLSKKIAEDKNKELTQPDYDPIVLKKLYKFRGEM